MEGKTGKTCPKCGQPGRESVRKFKAKGHVYHYLVMVHPDGRKCIIRRVEPPPPKAGEELQKLVEQLKAENEELKRRLEQLEREKQEAEARAQAVRYIIASGLLLGRDQIEALRLVYVKRKGYSEQQHEVARTVMATLIERGLQAGHALVTFPQPEVLNSLLS